jgi:PAS domain S-box-containing protein
MLNQTAVYFQTVLDTVLDGVIVIDSVGLIQEFNRAAEIIFQYTAEEVIGQNVDMLMPEPYHSAHDQYLKSFLETKNPKVIGIGREVTGERKDGSHFPMELGVNEMQIDNAVFFVGTVKDLSDRNNAERKAKEEAETLNAVMNTVIDGVITIQEDGTIASVNKAAERILQYSESELVGQNVKVLMPEPYRSGHDDYLRNYITSGTAQVIGIGREVKAQRKDGSVFDMELGVSEMTRDSQRMFVGTLRDITDKKRAELAKEQATRLSAIMNTVIDGLITIDQKGTIETFNEAAERIFGYTQSEVFGQNVRMLMPDPYQSNHDQYLTNYLNTGEKQIIGIGREVTAQRKDGSIFPMELAVNEMLIDDRRMFVGTIRDISDLKKAEQSNREAKQALQEVASRLDLATDAARIGIWEFNAVDGVLIWDRMMYEIHSTPSHVKDKLFDKWLDLIHPQDAKQLRAIKVKAKEQKTVFSEQFRLFDKFGQLRWMQLFCKPVFTPEGELHKIIGTAWDMSEIKHAEELKNEFLATMSHEIRTPINGIMGILQILSETELAPQQARYTELAQSSAKSLLTIINDILDFSKIEAGKLDIEHIEFNLHKLVSDVRQLMAFKADEKSLTLAIDLDENVPTYVLGDSGRLRQILNNLINNAVKFTEKGSITLSIQKVENDLIKFSIRDTGIGIPEERQASLFTRFSQVDASTTRKYGGTGLGLAISKELAVLMGGGIGVESELGVGSTFSFTVELPAVSAPQALTKSSSRGAQNVWILGSNEQHQHCLARPLTQLGMSVLEFENHSEILTKVQNRDIDKNPDVIFCLLGADAPSPSVLVPVLKSALEDNGIRFICVNVVSSVQHTAEQSDSVFDGFLSWPFRTDSILEAMSISSLKTLDTDETYQDSQTVLVAEDNEINQMVISNMLRSLGYESKICENGVCVLEHLKKVERGTYALVLMDCQMPVMDGYLTTQKIRQGEGGNQHEDITIVAVTANAMQGDEEKCFAAGMDDYLTKPIDKEGLAKKLSYWISVVRGATIDADLT